MSNQKPQTGEPFFTTRQEPIKVRDHTGRVIGTADSAVEGVQCVLIAERTAILRSWQSPYDFLTNYKPLFGEKENGTS